MRSGPGRELELLGTAGGHIDLIVLDLRLPQGRGVDLLRRLRGLGGACPPVRRVQRHHRERGRGHRTQRARRRQLRSKYTAPQHILPSLSPHLFPDHYNRRVSPRVTIGVPVSYRVGNMIASAVTLNVGPRGPGRADDEPGSRSVPRARVRFRLPGGKTEVDGEARVAWSRRGHGMGFRFGTLTPDVQATLDAFVHSHFFTNRKA